MEAESTGAELGSFWWNTQPPSAQTTWLVHKNDTSDGLETTCLEGGLITTQRAEEMNSARRHARRWRRSLEPFHRLLCSLVTQLPLAENTGLPSILSTCLKFLETDSPKHTENWNWSLTFPNQTGPKSIQSKRPNSLFMLFMFPWGGRWEDRRFPLKLFT